MYSAPRSVASRWWIPRPAVPPAAARGKQTTIKITSAILARCQMSGSPVHIVQRPPGLYTWRPLIRTAGLAPVPFIAGITNTGAFCSVAHRASVPSRPEPSRPQSATPPGSNHGQNPAVISRKRRRDSRIARRERCLRSTALAAAAGAAVRRLMEIRPPRQRSPTRSRCRRTPARRRLGLAY